MKLSISLNKPKAAQTKQPPLKPSAFGSAEEDVEENVEQTKTGSLALAAQTSKAMRKRIDAEKQVDASVFEYDEVWDKMQETKQRQKVAKEVDATAKKPKYIQGLLATASTRKLDHLRAEEKMMQREREAEGDMYADKESFVTQAYKDQMEEVRKAEEEEKKRDEARKKQGGTSIGLTHFYQKMLEENAMKHEETVAATEKRVIGPQAGPNLTINKPASMAPMGDSELAKLARAEGKEVELNDDGQIVDRVELLSAGLNLSLPNTRNLGKLTASTLKDGQDDQPIQTHRAVGTAASRREINERRAREIQQQLADEERRIEQQKMSEEERATQRAVAKRNNETSVEDARARFLERKRRKLEEAQQQPQDPAFL
ncbi:coiled-coil domain-containing protein 55-domain containing protein [Crepidotus variabilis]|uniref:Coiled-coil domain-containing protein 55-domain containing protein n=1 Tax=Crepidotus variabilis TaxID=179855 RepID=A0A9P6JUM5_9AGAR|nr:coiled-coil domain-containing protein 55-domain containing protein [Crepidotus variabilis]